MCLDFFLGEIQCSPSGFRERRRKFCPTPLGVQSRYKCKESGNKAVCTPDRFPALFHIFEIYSQDQEAPLHLAVKNNHIPIIHCLLSAGCDTNAIDKVPAAQYSNSWMNTSSIKCVLFYAVDGQRSQTALHVAADLAKIDVVEMLLKAEFDQTIQDKVWIS